MYNHVELEITVHTDMLPICANITQTVDITSIEKNDQMCNMLLNVFDEHTLYDGKKEQIHSRLNSLPL
jgi:hypothetical protein